MKNHGLWIIPMFIVMTLLVVAAGPASSAPLGDSSDVRFLNFSMKAPQERFDEWQSALARFAVRNPAMSRAQSEAILGLMELEDLVFFEETLDPQRRGIMVQRLNAFGKAFSYNDVSNLLLPLEDFRHWMTRNKLLAAIIVETPTCNCKNGWDCTSGYSCKSVTCISQAGSNASGVCTSNTTLDQ
jgi:hypothetical protein